MILGIVFIACAIIAAGLVYFWLAKMQKKDDKEDDIDDDYKYFMRR